MPSLQTAAYFTLRFLAVLILTATTFFASRWVFKEEEIVFHRVAFRIENPLIFVPGLPYAAVEQLFPIKYFSRLKAKYRCPASGMRPHVGMFCSRHFFLIEKEPTQIRMDFYLNDSVDLQKAIQEVKAELVDSISDRIEVYGKKLGIPPLPPYAQLVSAQAQGQINRTDVFWKKQIYLSLFTFFSSLVFFYRRLLR